jgi:MFS family permease
MIGIILAIVMLLPPLSFNQEKTGYMYTGAFVGAVIGFAIAGLLADSIPQYLTKLNKGKYEPEFRLFLVLPQLILGCAGLYGFGWASADPYTYGWFWPDFFFTLEVAGMVVGAVASSLYVVDAYREFSRFSKSKFSDGSRKLRDRGVHVHDVLQEYLQLRADVEGLRLAGRERVDQAHLRGHRQRSGRRVSADGAAV